MKTKIFFGLRADSQIRNCYTIGLVLFFISCVSTKYKKLSVENPSELIAMEDSLLRFESSTALYSSLGIAHNELGEKLLEEKKFLKAKNHFSNAIYYSENDTTYLYNHYITEGHILLRKGNKNGLWDGIEFYYKAAKLKPDLGEPHYYIGQSYQKLGNTDFDLIIESYQNALQLTLSNKLRKKVDLELENILNRKNRLESFWK